MKKIAFIFPGQGSQSVGMGKDFFDNSDIAKDMISKASERLGINFEELLFEDDGVTPQKYGNGNQKKEVHKCSADDPKVKFTSNYSLLFFHNKNKEDKIQYFLELQPENKILSKSDSNWNSDVGGHLFIAYQTKENDYHARSFEDAFFHINKDFILKESNSFASLTDKWLKKYLTDDVSVFEFSEKAVGSKPSLAIEILLNSKVDTDGNEFSNWEIPLYIKEGLEWLRKN